MLQGMLSQAKEARQEERVQYAAFKQFCDTTTSLRQKAVKDGDEKIDALKAHIQKFDTEAERLGTEIARHEEEIRGWTNDTQAADNVRETERGDYKAMHQNYTESIQALAKAISALKEQAYDRPSTKATSLLVQRASEAAPAPARRAIEAFLARGAEEPDLTFRPAPEAEAYEFRSHDIVAMLEQLKDKFREKLTELEKDEMQRKHSYDTVKQDLRDSIKAAKASISQKTDSRAQNKQGSAEASSSLADTTQTRKDDYEYLTDLVTTCQEKTSDFESRQKLRDDEIEALTKAVEILSGTAVAGAAEKHLPAAALLGRPRSPSLAHLRVNAPNKERLQAVADLLKFASARTGSSVLLAVAARARDDPFAKVKTLIQELLDRLIAQANEEAEHKGWCDSELATNKATRETKTEEVELLTAQTESLTAGIAKLNKEVAELSDAVAQLNKDIAAETSLRNKEKARNEQTLQEAGDAQTAMSEAISVLKDFYDKAGSATAFSQTSDSRQAPAGAPPIFDKSYTGMQDQKSGILGMLQVIQSDFARLEQDTASAEEAASQEYDKFMQDAVADKSQKESDIGHKKNELQTKEADLLDKQTDLDNAHKELDAAMATYDKLKPACLDTGSSFSERQSRREEELASLKEALAILNGEDVSVSHGVLVTGQGSTGPLRSETTGLDYGN
eukprot:TRINITY_DN19505_c0_g3_i1.p1 TRINITY_DN19505_c0_g3~~TRINITY_DN19505_c0_g3_i1.p1  ORF type:complete len:735 (+),score=125.87 TRINITY_DN19505_c0_g3_i1:176-2206(+)